MAKQLIGSLSQEALRTLEEMGRHHRYADFRFRARGIVSLHAQCKPETIAQVLGVSVHSVYNWAKWWREDGLSGLLNGHKGGRPAKLTAELVDHASAIAAAEPLALAGIKQRLQECHPDAPDFSLYRLSARLKQRGLRFKRCRLSLKKKRPERDFAGEKANLDKLKEAAREGRIHLFFADASGMSTVPHVQRAWSLVGQPHRADACGPRKRVNILGALDYAANTLTYTLHEASIKRPDVVAFIDRLAQPHRDGKLTFVVLDNASIHRHIDAEKIRTWLGNHQLILFPLPPYSPELNLIEILWKQAKYYWREFTAWSKQNLLREVNDIFQAYGEKFEISYA